MGKDFIFSELTEEHLYELTNELMPTGGVDANFLYNRTIDLANTVVNYKELMMMYSSAMKEVRIKLEIFNAEYELGHQRNPINSVQTRLKGVASIAEKLERNDLQFSLENIENNIFDVAGVRVICPYVDDIYDIADALKNQESIEIIAEKDYIANPKPNGYRSLHLIIKIPVNFTNQVKKVNVEVQIRTIAMDFWATLEHQLKYRKQINNSDEIALQLRECSAVISATDSQMLSIRKQIEENSKDPSEEEILFEKIKKFDLPIE